MARCLCGGGCPCNERKQNNQKFERWLYGAPLRRYGGDNYTFAVLSSFFKMRQSRKTQPSERNVLIVEVNLGVRLRGFILSAHLRTLWAVKDFVD